MVTRDWANLSQQVRFVNGWSGGWGLWGAGAKRHGELCEWVNGWSVDGWWVVYTYMPSTCSWGASVLEAAMTRQTCDNARELQAYEALEN